jgi:hypothetical protein
MYVARTHTIMPAASKDSKTIQSAAVADSSCRWVADDSNKGENQMRQPTSSQPRRSPSSSSADARTLFLLPVCVIQHEYSYALSCSMPITPAATRPQGQRGAAAWPASWRSWLPSWRASWRRRRTRLSRRRLWSLARRVRRRETASPAAQTQGTVCTRCAVACRGCALLRKWTSIVHRAR